MRRRGRYEEEGGDGKGEKERGVGAEVQKGIFFEVIPCVFGSLLLH